MMNEKRLAALVLALVLTLTAVPALAAPSRDLQAMEVTVDEKLQTLVNIACLAIPEECYGMDACAVLEKDQAPGASLTAQALWAAMLTAREASALSTEEAQDLYRQIFTSGTYEQPSKDALSPFLTATDSGLEVNPEYAYASADNAFIYSVSFDGTDVLLQCDLYQCEVEGADVNEVPDILLSWTNHAAISLRFSPETEFGYTVNSIVLSPCYRDGNFGDWWEAENQEIGYSLNVPGSLELADGTPEHWTFKNVEGDVALTIDAEENNLTYDQALAAFMQAHKGLDVQQERLYDAFLSLEEGVFMMVVTTDEHPWTYTVTMTFPADRQEEYAFYAEIIRNSFGVRGLSNG